MLGEKIHFEKKGLPSTFRKNTGFIHAPLSNTKSGAGFTLVELFVVLAIIVLLTGMIFINYRQGGTQLALQRSANKLAQDIRRAEEMAMSTREYKGMVPLGGYGIYLTITPPDQNHYILFADCDGDYEYDNPDCGSVGCASDCALAVPANPYPEKIEDIKFESEVITSVLSLSPLTITLTPPDPTVRINQLTTSPAAVITLKIGVDTRTVTVNNVGLVTID